MQIQEIKPSIYSVGSVDPDREYFDQLIPLPDGTSYNSYLIKGSEKTALIDTVYPPKEREIIDKLKYLNITKLDYIIANHGEQDHSGSLVALLKIYPEATVITNPKCKEIMLDLHPGLDADRIQVIKDNETLSLGNKTLQFIYAPWVHWPDTMFTHLIEDKILFTCDFFGSHLSETDLFYDNKEKIYCAAKRYYAEIMMPFRAIFKKYFDKIEALNVDMIAPSHGPVYKDTKFIIDAYREWASDDVKNMAVIVYISMYGSTSDMIDHFTRDLEQKGIKVKAHNVVDMDLGELAMDIVDAATIIFATPTVLTGPHPNIVGPTYLINILKPKVKFTGIIGSYNWGGFMVDKMKETLCHLKAEMLEPVMIKGHARDGDYDLLNKLALDIFEKHRSVIPQISKA